VLNSVWLISGKTLMGTDRLVRYTLNDLATLSQTGQNETEEAEKVNVVTDSKNM
jgi:hypothetical protein